MPRYVPGWHRGWPAVMDNRPHLGLCHRHRMVLVVGLRLQELLSARVVLLVLLLAEELLLVMTVTRALVMTLMGKHGNTCMALHHGLGWVGSCFAFS